MVFDKSVKRSFGNNLGNLQNKQLYLQRDLSKTNHLFEQRARGRLIYPRHHRPFVLSHSKSHPWVFLIVVCCNTNGTYTFD